MRKLYSFLKWVLIAVWGIFAGLAVYHCYDYYAYPQKYLVNSAPWYLSIQLNGLTAVCTSAVILILMWIIRKKK